MKSKLFLFVLLGITTLIYFGCTAPMAETKSINVESLKPEIQAMEDAFAAAEKAKNADGVVAYYSEDAVSYSRNEEPTIGKSSIKKRVAEHLAKDTTGNVNVYKVVDLFAEGNMAVEIGSWKVQTPTGTEVDKGYYLSYFQKRDGKYVCVRDMNVTTNPVKETK
ncbi:MAG: nuclear transport factor 2 family protein [Saprospiraceae bacterium]